MLIAYVLTYLGTGRDLPGDGRGLADPDRRAPVSPRMGAIMADKPSLGPAAAFYLIYIAAIVALAVLPAVKADSWSQLLGRAALFGLAAYATYDLTNQATLKDLVHDLVTVADLAWGTVATTAAASVGFRDRIRKAS
jgi:uncharacterized membrane protein